MIHTQSAIAGGGPAGMMLGFLLARAGVDVVVLEKHADFLRDFRGDTIHPSTLEVIFELGLLDTFLARPHSEVREVGGRVGDEVVLLADFTRLPTRCKFLAFMPQWDFLDFLADQGRRYPAFHLMMKAAVEDVRTREGRVVGLRASTPDGPIDIESTLVVGADGRQSTVRAKAGLEVERLGAPMDVLWFRLTKHARDPGIILGRVARGRLMVMIDRSSYWQCGFLIRKGALDELKRRGLDSFRHDIVERRALSRRSRRRDHRLEPGETADGGGRSPAPVVSARLVVHRRRCACDVADGRRRHQPCDSGRGGRRQPAR